MFNINFFKEISHTFPTKQYVNGCLQLTFFNFQKLHKTPKIRLVKGFAGLSILNNFLISITLTPSFKVRILTLTLQVADLLPAFAVITAVPGAIAVTFPVAESICTIAVLLEDQTTLSAPPSLMNKSDSSHYI